MKLYRTITTEHRNRNYITQARSQPKFTGVLPPPPFPSPPLPSFLFFPPIFSCPLPSPLLPSPLFLSPFLSANNT